MTHSAMTDTDRIQELDRQLRMVERGEIKKVFCPWCQTLNFPDAPDCCRRFTDECEQRGERQLQMLLQQHRSVMQGKATCITCPYCAAHNYAPEGNPAQVSPYRTNPVDWKRPMISPFCCDLFQAAAVAIAERMQTNALIEHRQRIDEANAKAGSN